MAKWSTNEVIGLINHGTGLLTEIIRTFRSPDRVLQHIRDRTQELKNAEKAIDDAVRAKYAKEPSDDDTSND